MLISAGVNITEYRQGIIQSNYSFWTHMNNSAIQTLSHFSTLLYNVIPESIS